MALANQNFELWSGDTLNLQFTVTDGSGKAIDLTGATITWLLYKNVSGVEADVTHTVGSGLTITDATNGMFTVNLQPTDTQGFSGTYYHEAHVTDAEGNQSTVTTGTVTIVETHRV